MMSSDAKFSILIHEISTLTSRLFNKRVREMGLTRSQWMVLFWLYSDGVQSQTNLATKLSIAKQPLGKVVDKLEQDGWIVRKQNPNDRREKLVSVTDKIQPLITPLSEVIDDIDKLALANLSVKGRSEAINMLSDIKANLVNRLD